MAPPIDWYSVDRDLRDLARYSSSPIASLFQETVVNETVQQYIDKTEGVMDAFWERYGEDVLPEIQAWDRFNSRNIQNTLEQARANNAETLLKFCRDSLNAFADAIIARATVLEGNRVRARRRSGQ